MNLLIDTHAVIWFITDDDQLPINIKELIEDTTNTCFVSIASLWEMGIKYSLGKLDLKADIKDTRIDGSKRPSHGGLTILPITTIHILANTMLDFHHRDPFDRLIIAQAKSEGLTLISKDGEFKGYNINLIWKEGEPAPNKTHPQVWGKGVSKLISPSIDIDKKTPTSRPPHLSLGQITRINENISRRKQ